MQQLIQEISQVKQSLLPLELTTAILISMLKNYITIVQDINAVDKETDLVYIYTKLISKEQR